MNKKSFRIFIFLLLPVLSALHSQGLDVGVSRVFSTNNFMFSFHGFIQHPYAQYWVGYIPTFFDSDEEALIRVFLDPRERASSKAVIFLCSVKNRA